MSCNKWIVIRWHLVHVIKNYDQNWHWLGSPCWFRYRDQRSCGPERLNCSFTLGGGLSRSELRHTGKSTWRNLDCLKPVSGLWINRILSPGMWTKHYINKKKKKAKNQMKEILKTWWRLLFLFVYSKWNKIWRSMDCLSWRKYNFEVKQIARQSKFLFCVNYSSINKILKEKIYIYPNINPPMIYCYPLAALKKGV